jgi:hypothetical protein
MCDPYRSQLLLEGRYFLDETIIGDGQGCRLGRDDHSDRVAGPLDGSFESVGCHCEGQGDEQALSDKCDVVDCYERKVRAEVSGLGDENETM